MGRSQLIAMAGRGSFRTYCAPEGHGIIFRVAEGDHPPYVKRAIWKTHRSEFVKVYSKTGARPHRHGDGTPKMS